MKDVKINISENYFPTQFASDSEKKTMEYGLQIGQAIQYEWFRKDGGNCRFYSRYEDYWRLRLYARGEQSVQKYKNELAIDGDLSYLNLDWTPVPIIPKFVDIIVNGMSDRLFNVKAYAQDALSAEQRNEFQEQIEGQMVAKELLLQISENFQVDPFAGDPEELPNSADELNLYMQLNYKPAMEIAEEEAINTLFDENHYQDVRKRCDYDLAVLGTAMVKHEFLLGDGVRINYVDPINVVHSYTEDPHYKDCFYWGEIKTVPITELVKIDPTITNDQLEEISKYSQNWYQYFNTASFYEDSMFNKDTATLLYFNYKTTNKFVYKKKILENGGSRIIEKDDQFNPPEEVMQEGNFERIEKNIDVWYEGIMVMGTNIILKWEMSENMVRPKSATQHAVPNYIAVSPRLYKGNVESLVRRMIPFADQIQITHLKMQQVTSRMVPDGVYLDADGLNEVDMGTGQSYNPEDALRLYFQTGSVVGRSYTQDGDFNNARVPIQPLVGNTGSQKMAALINNYNHYLNMLRDVTGINEARDGSTPSPDALVGVQKLAAANSNTATRHVLDASLYLTRTLAEALSCRVSDILEYADFAEEFAMQIGKYNVALLDAMKDLYLYDFGIFIQVAPDEEEKAQLEANIQMALSKNDISLEDAIDIREVHNIKMANQLLKIKRQKKQQADEKREMLKQQMQIQGNMQTQQMASEAAMQRIQVEGQMKMQEKQAEVAFEIEKMKSEAQLKAQLMQQEFQYNMAIRGVDEKNLNMREQSREDAKSERISQQNTQQSKLIQQRQYGLPPQNFESNEDTLDGFDLSEFEPR